MKYIVLLGRLLYSWIFIPTIISHFSKGAADHAAAAGVPMASLLVPASGILASVGAMSILLGFKAKIGAWMIVLFLVPVTLTMHNWWAVTDPMMQQMQHAMFNKNMSILGAALLIAYFGSGPLSLDSIIARSNTIAGK